MPIVFLPSTNHICKHLRLMNLNQTLTLRNIFSYIINLYFFDLVLIKSLRWIVAIKPTVLRYIFLLEEILLGAWTDKVITV